MALFGAHLHFRQMRQLPYTLYHTNSIENNQTKAFSNSISLISINNNSLMENQSNSIYHFLISCQRWMEAIPMHITSTSSSITTLDSFNFNQSHSQKKINLSWHHQQTQLRMVSFISIQIHFGFLTINIFLFT